MHLFWRDAQNASRRFRGSRLAAGLAFTAVIAVGAGITLAVPSGPNSASAKTAASSIVSDPDSVLDERSPGVRRYGWLLNTKQPRLGFSAGDPPHERVLTSMRRRPTPAGGPLPLVGPITPVEAFPEVAGVVPDQMPELADTGSGPGSGGFIPTPGLGGIGPGGGGPAGGNPDDGNGTTTTPTPVPSVPEPSTWIMLLLGFAILGRAMRRGRLTLAYTH